MSIWEHYQYWHGGGFCRFDPPMRELHWRKLNKTLFYEIDAECSHWAMKTWWIGPPRGNGMPRDQWSRRLIDPTSGCRVMSSWKSHENVIQGHLVTLGPRAKKQTEEQYCIPLALTSVYGKCWYGNTTKTRTVEGFQTWPTNARVVLKEIEQNPILWNRCTMKSIGHENMKERSH